MIYDFFDRLIIKFFSFIISSINDKYKYRRNFKKIRFFDKCKKYPKIINVKKYTRDRAVIVCRSVIPLSIWKNSIEEIETTFNSRVKVMATKQKQVIKLILLKGVGKSGL